MGLLRLLVHDDQRLKAIDPARVHMIGFDELPWLGRVTIADHQIVIQRAEDDSGMVCVPFQVASRGKLLLSTTTLMEREEPYLLEVELSRGVVHRLRNQLATWMNLGLVVSDELLALVQSATNAFTRAAARLHDRETATKLANESIVLGVEATEQLTDLYASQALEHRLDQSGKLHTLLGVELGEELPSESLRQSIAESFNLVSVPMSWRTIEASEGKRNWLESDSQLHWARENRLKVVGGPLLEFDERRVPDWTYLWEGDFSTLESLMRDHVKKTVKRYRGKVHLWHVSARMNRVGVLSLNDEERLQIVAMAVQTVKKIDPQTPVIVSFDQPWAEYMSGKQVEMAPIHFADALVRADLGIAGLGVELNIGDQPRATAPRLPTSFSRLIDTWSLFELPLFITLTVGTKTTQQFGDAASPDSESSDSGSSEEATLSPALSPSRMEWIEHYLPALLAKHSVQVVLWNQLSDHKAEFPNAGLFDDSGQPKPALNALKQLRDQYLL